MKTSEFIVSYLKTLNVKIIHGYIGGVVTPLLDSVYKNPHVNFFSCQHEQASSFAASASAKYNNSLQVVVATSGPGATNLITGIADAYFDSAPVLFITGQVNTYDFKFNKKIRQQGFQETDIVSIVKPITKYCSLIKDSNQVVNELKKAISIALSGRKGPVLLDIPFNIQQSNIELSDDAFDLKIKTNEDKISEKDLKDIRDMISASKMPLILAGGGCSSSNAKNLLTNFAEIIDAPVVVSLMGKDSFSHNHRLFAGFIGAYGNRYGNILLSRSDLLIVLGSRLDSRQVGNNVESFNDKKIIWIDIENEEILYSKLYPKKVIKCDLKIFLKRMISFLKINNINYTRTKYVTLLSTLKTQFHSLSELKRAGKINWHYQIMDKISSYMSDDDVMCVDVGQSQMIAAQTINIINNQRFINSGGMAPMGYALPAAIGISKTFNKRTIVVAGDGGLQMNIQELNVVAKNNLPIIIIVFNNKSLGMIKQFQELYFDKNYVATDESSGYYSCDFESIAKSYSINSFKISRNSKNIDKIIKEIFNNYQTPTLLEIDLDYDTYVYPKLSFDKQIENLNPALTPLELENLEKILSEI